MSTRKIGWLLSAAVDCFTHRTYKDMLFPDEIC